MMLFDLPPISSFTPDLSDEALTSRLGALAAEERKVSADFIVCLGEFDRRRLYLGWLQLISQVTIALYSSPSSAEAWQAAVRGWPALQRTMLLRFQQANIDAHGLRARAALCAAAGAHGRDRETFLRHAEKDARKIEREKSPWGSPMALLLRAAVAHLRALPDRARSLLDQAATQFDQADMPGHAAIARFRLGELLGGDQGQALVAAQVAYMHNETIRNPARWADLLAPGFAQGRATAAR